MNYRKVTAIVRLDRLENVEEHLKNLRIPGISVTRVKGFGEFANFFKADWMSSHARVEIFVAQQRAEEIANAIMEAAHTGEEGDGIVAILPVESLYQIRTKEISAFI